MGDSLSAAYGIDPDKGWVALLDTKLKAHHLPYSIINASISGYTTSEGLTALPQALADYHPKIVIIALGSNDGLRGLSTQVMQQNLKKMIKLSLAAKARVLLVGFLIPVNYGPVYRTEFEAVFKDLANNYGLLRVPFLLQSVALNPKLMQSDGLHPNVDAQPILAETVWPYLQQLL